MSGVIKSWEHNIKSISSDYDATPNDRVLLVDSTGGLVTVTLPEASSVLGLKLEIKKVDSSANQVDISRRNTDLIEGKTAISLYSQYSTTILEAIGVDDWGIASAGTVEATETLLGTIFLKQTGYNKFIGTKPQAIPGGAWYDTIADAAPAAGDRILVMESYSISGTETWDFDDVFIQFMPGASLLINNPVTVALNITGDRNHIYDLRMQSNDATSYGVTIDGATNQIYGAYIHGNGTLTYAIRINGTANMFIGMHGGSVSNTLYTTIGTDSIIMANGIILPQDKVYNPVYV